ncbi:hypothetical protein AC579_8131 [Pseudocercospora musae]|uniref:Uncharacterized protein n=1 Tax=Pseudocercospora musae TaxID=113226 RepID=A0A139IGA0_9PEZI|nr:hypothetical protein AC579_8131 [Pseudocercospora musae]
MIAVFAAKYTHKVKKLVLSGYIKTSTKNMWLRYNRNDMDTDTRRDIEREKRIISDMVRDQFTTLYTDDYMFASGATVLEPLGKRKKTVNILSRYQILCRRA